MPEPATWAKAPDPEGEAERSLRRDETLRDIREYTESGFREHPCDGCGQHVLVRKSSPGQTSIQWTAEAARSCPELATRRGHAAEGCAKLAASIDRAVRDGRIPVGEGG